MKKTSILTNGLLLLTAMIWGFAFVAQVHGANYLMPLTFNGVRFCVGVLSLLPVVLIFEKGRDSKPIRKKTMVASLLAGTVLFCASSLQQIGIGYTRSAGVAGFITGLYIVLIPIASFLLFRHKTGGQVWLGAVFALLGLFLLCYKIGEGFQFGMGEFLLLIGSFFWTAHMILVDRLGKELRSLHFAWGQFFVCALLGILAMFLFEEPNMDGIVSAKWSILYCGVLSVGVAYTLQVISQKKADPTFAAIVLSMESVFSAIGGAIVGTDNISSLGYIGCALIFAGVVISQLPRRRKKSLDP